MSLFLSSPPQRNRGFTLIELISVIAVMVIIGYMSVPSYLAYVTDKRQDEGKQKILEIMQKQNQFKMMSAPYQFTLDLSQLGYTLTSGAVMSKSVDPGFRITAANCTTPSVMNDLGYCVVVRATPISATRGDST